MRILVLGGLGRQGRIIAERLILQSPLNQVDIADSVLGISPPDGTHHFVITNLSDYNVLTDLLEDCDLAVCALPAALGYDVVRACVETSTNLVDLSFSEGDLSVFDQEAKDKGIAIIHDAGVAPGLSNLVAGRAMLGNPNSIEILVGGFARYDGYEPFDYAITWSLDDLMEEYTRPARILVDGEVQEVPALSGLELVRILHSGEFYGTDGAFEAFYTDGLRSILTNNGGVPNITEKTLRWPGHVEAVSAFLDKGKGFLKNKLEEECREDAQDKLVMRITTDDNQTVLEVNNDETMSAMAKTTALSCFTFASLITSGTLTATGVLPPELLSADDDVYKFVLDQMATYGVQFSTYFGQQYPFM